MKDITVQLLHKYYECNKLDSLRQVIPQTRGVVVDLSLLYKYMTGLKFFENTVPISDIHTACVYGSTLYRNLPRSKEIYRTQKKYFFFGPKIQYKVVRDIPIKTPNDFDILVVTKSSFTDDKIVIPKRVYTNQYESVGYSRWQGVERRCDGYGYYEVQYSSSIKVHICYRSIEQFHNGVVGGDGVSASAAKFGIPLFNRLEFSEITKEVSDRVVNHRVQWDENEDGCLCGNVL
jgi:hypothetical protein